MQCTVQNSNSFDSQNIILHYASIWFQLISHQEPITFSVIVRQTIHNSQGLRNRQTFMGRVKRFERRRPKLAQMIRFYLIFVVFGVTVLSLMPGNSIAIIYRYLLISIVLGSSLPFQTGLKIGIFHIKAWFNYHWNYKISNQNEKYLYLLLEDLIAEMNYHQIYELKEFQRVFGEVYRVVEEDFDILRKNLLVEVNRVKEKSQFMTVRTEQKDTESVASKMLVNQNDSKNKHKLQQTSVTANTKKNQLKNKLKNEMDAKYKGTKQQHTKKEQQLRSAQSRKAQKKSKQQPNSVTNKNSQQAQSPLKTDVIQKNSTETSLLNSANKQNGTTQAGQQINLKSLLSGSLCNSASFRYNMLLYYVLILENVLRYETKLIKQGGFYDIYRKGVEEFVFSDNIQILLKGLIQNKNSKDGNSEVKQSEISQQVYTELREQVQKEIQFAKLLRGSVLMGGYSKDKHQPADESIDPHKLLTYLINYRHLIHQHEPITVNTWLNVATQDKQLLPKQQSQVNQKDSANRTILTISQQASSSRKINSIQDILINYLKLISVQQGNNSQSLPVMTKVIKGLQSQHKMIQLAVSNKPFINSLKNLYLSDKKRYQQKIQKQKQANGLQNVQGQTNKRHKPQTKNSKNKKEQQSLLVNFKGRVDKLRKIPVHKLVQSVFFRIDQWYGLNLQNNKL